MAGVISVTNRTSRRLSVTPPPASVHVLRHRPAPFAPSVLGQVCSQATGLWQFQGPAAVEFGAFAQRDPMTGAQGSDRPGYRPFVGVKAHAVAVRGVAYRITVPTSTVPTTTTPTTVRKDEPDPGPTVWSPPV